MPNQKRSRQAQQTHNEAFDLDANKAEHLKQFGEKLMKMASFITSRFAKKITVRDTKGRTQRKVLMENGAPVIPHPPVKQMHDMLNSNYVNAPTEAAKLSVLTKLLTEFADSTLPLHDRIIARDVSALFEIQSILFTPAMKQLLQKADQVEIQNKYPVQKRTCTHVMEHVRSIRTTVAADKLLLNDDLNELVQLTTGVTKADGSIDWPQMMHAMKNMDPQLLQKIEHVIHDPVMMGSLSRGIQHS